METGTTSSMIYHLKSKHEDIFAMHPFTRDPSVPSFPRKRLDGGHRLPGRVADLGTIPKDLSCRIRNTFSPDSDPREPSLNLKSFIGKCKV